MTKRITTEQLEAIRKRAEAAKGRGIGTREDLEFRAHAREDISALLAEVERLRNLIASNVSCSVCVNQIDDGWEYDEDYGELVCGECFDNRYGGDTE